jgi:hypothetical protein
MPATICAGPRYNQPAPNPRTTATSTVAVNAAELRHSEARTGPFDHAWQAPSNRRPTSSTCFSMAQTPRSSSLVESLNSRLRNYFTRHRHLGGSYLDSLRFFLNHRRFMRSRRAERNGKSPRELMTGQGHPHWLTLLGLGPLQPRYA